MRVRRTRLATATVLATMVAMIGTLLGTGGAEAATTGRSQQWNASGGSPIITADRTSASGQQVRMNSRATAWTAINGSGTLTFYARGEMCHGSPVAIVYLDGQKRGQVTVTNTGGWTAYRITTGVGSGLHSAALEFANDAYDPAAGCDRNLVGGWFTLTSATTSTPPPATKAFRTSGSTIYTPAGKPFVGIGANVGLTNSFDWKGTALGHAPQAKEWRWNIVRLNVLATNVIPWSYLANRSNTYAGFLAQVDQVVKQYTSRGIVVMISTHDDLMNPKDKQATTLAQLDRFWRDMAKRYKGNSYVWFNLHNEPPQWDPAPWRQVHERYLGPIRAAGAKNIVVVDAPTWGIDLGPAKDRPKVKFGYDPTMAPALAKKYGNVVLSMHNYGYGHSTTQTLSAYVDKVRKSGVPIVIGEFGYRLDGLKEWSWGNLNSVDGDTKATNAVFGIQRAKGLSILWWHGTHGDSRSLKSDYSAFWEHGSGNMLSAPGKRLWALTH